MEHRYQHEMEVGIDPLPKSSPPPTRGLTISAANKQALSPAQVEFNKRMKALEKERANHERQRARLDKELHLCTTELMPLVEASNRAERELIFAAVKARTSLKLTPKRNKWLGDLISGKAADLLADPTGLSPEEIDQLEALIKELGPSFLDEERREMDMEEFDELRDFMEDMARQAGVELDLSGIDLQGDPVEVDRQFRERFDAAEGTFQKANQGTAASGKRKRKPSKAELERERLREEVEAAKSRDLKSLYKQLAKVLHPDLETDPVLRAHKENWMKRLNTAQANGDLRDMLAIEMEWLGEEAGNLAKASDEKLRIYSMVLKEQLEDLREQTVMLIHEPQYHTIMRFTGPYGVLRNPALTKRDLLDERSRLEEMAAVLRQGDTHTRTLLNQWADAHARMCSR
ncbi:MAG: hypothetical protein WCH40_07910 [Verrucomicrobiales bacterium]